MSDGGNEAKPQAAIAADRLVALAAEASARGGGDDLAVFVESYRAWLIAHHELPGSQPERTERTRLLLHAMASASTLGEAVALLARFRRLVWGDRGLAVLVEDTGVSLVLDQPYCAGVTGLVSDVWSLSLLLTELEFLAGGQLKGVSGAVRQPGRLPASVVGLLFDRPLAVGSDMLRLHLPAAHLSRPVVAPVAAIPEFLARLVPATVAVARPEPRLAPLVASMIRAEVRHAFGRPASLDAVAVRLGMSVATLRRRLVDEGSTYRHLRNRILGEIAVDLLARGDAVEAIAARLGYSDAFSFRRAFRRHHGCSPTAWRGRRAPGDGEGATSDDQSVSTTPPSTRSAAPVVAEASGDAT